MSSPDTRIFQLNVEGLTQAKRDLIHHLANENNVNVLLLQETHIDSEEKLLIEGFSTVAFVPSKHHGIATYVREGIQVNSTQQSPPCNEIEWIVINLGDTSIINVYKPPPSVLTPQCLPCGGTTSIVCGDFNSRNTMWGYPDTNQNGDTIEQWADLCNLHLLYDAKDNKSFFSGRHKTWTNPDLCFISRNLTSSCERTVLEKFPRSGHCPIVISSKVSFKINSLGKKRWNFRKADWAKFTDHTESLSKDLPNPAGETSDAYRAFTNMLSVAAKASIPRGHRKNYIPCWDKECESALNAYNTASPDEKPSKSDLLMEVLGNKRRTRWEETVSSIDFTHSSRQAWSSINRLTGRSSKPKPCLVTANSIASVLVENGKWKTKNEESKAHTYKVNAGIKELTNRLPATSNFSRSITLEEVMDAILCLRAGKAPGVDLVHAEFLCHLGICTLQWLSGFLSNCLETSTIPAIWRQAKVTAILKPKKPAEDPRSYRPISLLCISYKLMERIILIRINDIVEAHLPHEQAGFRRGRSTTDQIVRLTHDIEAAFQRKEKFGVVYIDLTAAYDTVWHRGLYLKLLQLIPDVRLVRFIMTMLHNRTFYVVTSSGDHSRKRKLRNGLPQGSVLAPILFNIYTADYPQTKSSKYLYADDSAIGFPARTYEEIQTTLESDLNLLCSYLDLWHLKLSEIKTVCTIYHLANRLAKLELKIQLHGKRLRFDPVPAYLGVSLDRSLTYGQHLKNIAEKISKRVNIIRKLVGANWGAKFTTLRTSTLALVYSTAEYASPVWSHSVHTKAVDTVLNNAMRVISGTLKPTPTAMLPVVSGIPPPSLRRDFQVLKLAEKAKEVGSLIPSPDNMTAPQRIKRVHFATRAIQLQIMHPPLSASWIQQRWEEEWKGMQTGLHRYIRTPSSEPSGYQLDRHAWVQLNRIRTGCGKTRSFMKSIGVLDNDTCDCGHTQTIEHILEACPILRPPRGLQGLIDLDSDSVGWLQSSQL